MPFSLVQKATVIVESRQLIQGCAMEQAISVDAEVQHEKAVELDASLLPPEVSLTVGTLKP